MATDTELLIDDDGDEERRRLEEEEQVEEERTHKANRDSRLFDLEETGEEGKRSRVQHIQGRDLIVAVFVVAFDTKKGNVVEWAYPEEVNLDGVEFRAMASGFHNVTTDFIYFKHNQLFGLSCYEKLSVSNVEERGARMKSVGIIAVSYSNLHNHMEFLSQQAKFRVHNPNCDYESLVSYFWSIQAPRAPPMSPSSLATADLPHMEITHPAGCFSQFLEYFGAKAFALWKLALLKKRILIFSPPPIGVICYRVYCLCLLASHNIDNFELDTGQNPLFFVNVADIDQISSLQSYIACTTERILESKTHLYDVYIDNQTILPTSNRLDCFLRLTPADEQRYTQLIHSQDLAFTLSRTMKDKTEQDIMFAKFFQQLNTELYQALIEVNGESCEDHVMTCEMVQQLGLHGKDHFFLTELASLHQLNVTVQRQNDAFPCCI